MNGDDIFDRWKRQRGSMESQSEFTRRVMDQLPTNAPRNRSRWLIAAMLILSLGSAAIHLAIALLLTLSGINNGS